jgi:hypothetical protein
MNMVIIGGNEKMEETYREVCQKHNYDAKIFTKVSGGVRDKIGYPDRIIIFTGTVAHKMSTVAKREAKRRYIPITYVHSSSVSALEQVLSAQ